MHYVQSQRIPGTNRLLPIEQRSLGAIYKLLSNESFNDLDNRFEALPKSHPAKAPYGIFKLANRQIWGNIAIGLGNRLSVFQNTQMEKITAHNDIDLTLPGRNPCAYYCVISAQDSQYEFLSSLFFSCLFTRLTDFARREGVNGRLPVCVNFLLEEFCNIGKLVDFKKQLAILRGFNINCQVIVQSVAGLADRYEKKEWEEIISHCDTTICLGVNDLMTAQYISDKCGQITIRVDNNQMPLMPLFSPVYTSTRPYSQTRSNTQRALMMPDEIMRMDNKKCIVLLRGQKPLLLDKITPEEFPAQAKLQYTKITDYVPAWRKEKPASPSTAEVEPDAPPPQQYVNRQVDRPSDKADTSVTVSSPFEERETIAGSDTADTANSPAWYSRLGYAVSSDAPENGGDTLRRVPAENERQPSSAPQPPPAKYGGLQPVEAPLRDVKERGRVRGQE